MSAREFKFISPGVFINEIDNSQIPQEIGDVGPVIIGRADFGPALIPTKVSSFEEFVQVFGSPQPGREGGDVARMGNRVGPTYGAYAAQAWLKNSSPLTYVRLVGKQNAQVLDGGAGEAGWKTTNTNPVPDTSCGGAYGLFVFQSGSAGSTTTASGTLAAVWYVNSGSVGLSGTVVNSDGTGKLVVVKQPDSFPVTNAWVRATANQEFKVMISSGSSAGGQNTVDTSFNFTPSSENFIRNRFNVNPTLTNDEITDSSATQGYWLGETFEDQVTNTLNGASGDQYGVIVPLFDKNNNSGADFKADYSDPATGYFIAQDLQSTTGTFDAGDPQRVSQLFRLRARNTGRWASRNIKVSISDIRAGSQNRPYGTFSVQIRQMKDTDNRPKVLEQFNNCNLNPASQNYIGRKIGDKYVEWDDKTRKYQEYGNYPNLSEYVYLDPTEALAEGRLNPELIPFGVVGPPRFKSWVSNATTTDSLVTGGQNYAGPGLDVFTGGGGGSAGNLNRIVSGSGVLAVTFNFPSLRLRVSASEGTPNDPLDVPYFGVDTTFNKKGTASDTVGDYTGRLPGFITGENIYEAGATGTENSFIFTLDDMTRLATGNKGNVYVSGSRQAAGPHASSIRIGKELIGSSSYKDILNAGCDQFTTVFHGGFDGLDITEAEPFRNTLLSDVDATTSYAYNSITVAIDSLRDPENVEYDIAAMPGITNTDLNRALIDMCEDRGDALAVVDLAGGYVPFTEDTRKESARLGSVDATISELQNELNVNSSFATTYYPWIQLRDTTRGTILWAPPSIAAIGAMSYGQRIQELWFAPAGFTRGGLSVQGAAGIPVVGVRERLTSKMRDDLYEANINPIAQFPAEGIVIFGQKTLQVTSSALDRVNVRRLLIFLKRQISRIAATLLFDQNVQSTWNRFRGRVEPLLSDVRSGLGLSDYRLILDETTTTPDLIDRNIMYAKILLKPARSIEFIAIDFVITDSGASFED